MTADILGIIWGQSNAVGFADAFATGGAAANASGSDGNLYSAFAACQYAQLSSTAPAVSGAQTYNINVGPEALQPYAAAGGNNDGCANSIGRNLVKYGLATAPWLGVCGIGSTSIPGHWLPAAGGTSGVYSNFVNFISTQLTNSGRSTVDFFVHQIGETDANTPARVTSAVADITSMYNSLATSLPATANAIIILVMVNPNANLAGDGDVAGYRTQQVAFKNGSSRTVILVDPDNIPVPSDPHYRASGYWDLGVRIVLALKSRIAPTASLDRGAGPAPWLQADGSVETTQNATFPAIPRGEFGQVGEVPGRDVQFLFTSSYTQANADHNLSGSGWTRVGGLLDSTVASNHRQMSCWWRPVVAANMVGPDAAGNMRMPSPSITFPTSTGNMARIITMRGLDPNNPIAVALSNTVTAAATTFKIPASTTPTTVPANATALVVVAHNGTTDSVSSIANANVSGSAIAVARDSRVNPGSLTIGMAHGAAPIVGTSLAQTTITYSASTVGVGYVLVLNPDPNFGNNVQLVDDTASGTGSFAPPGLTGTGAVQLLDDVGTGVGLPALIGTGTVQLADDSGDGIGLPALIASGASTLADDVAGGSGFIGFPPVTGVGAIALADDVGAGIGLGPLVGTASIQLADDTASGIAGPLATAKPRLFAELALDGITPFTLVGPISVCRGDTVDLVITFTDDTDHVFDLNFVAEIELQIKAAKDDSQPLVAKSVSSGSIMKRLDIAGRADVSLSGADTMLMPGLYWIDVVAIIAGRRQHSVRPREFIVAAVVNAAN